MEGEVEEERWCLSVLVYYMFSTGWGKVEIPMWI